MDEEIHFLISIACESIYTFLIQRPEWKVNLSYYLFDVCRQVCVCVWSVYYVFDLAIVVLLSFFFAHSKIFRCDRDHFTNCKSSNPLIISISHKLISITHELLPYWNIWHKLTNSHPNTPGINGGANFLQWPHKSKLIGSNAETNSLSSSVQCNWHLLKR